MNNRHNSPSSGYTPYQSPSQTTITTTYSAFPPRTSSSNKNLPQPPPTTSSPSPATTTTMTSGYNNPLFTSRRTPSQSTTTSTRSIHHHNAMYPARHPSDVSSSRVSRTSSTRSSNPSPSSYVALMRKQKATVWCDRSQHEDPRTVAQKKAAKIRATREITGSGALLLADAAGRTSTSGGGSFTGSGSLGVRSKIRHHGVPKASGYSTANMVGGGVPMRLSANEVGDEGMYLGNPSGSGGNNNNNNNNGGGGLGPGGGGGVGGRHIRTSSAHSRDSRVVSGGGQYLTVDTQGTVAGRRMSQGSTPISGGGRESIPELSEDVPADKRPPLPPSKDSSGEGGYWAPTTGRRKSGLTEGDRENSFGKVGGMDAPVSASKAKQQEGKSDDDLRRRGSVDERANTMGFMGGGRLFVANPDLSD